MAIEKYKIDELDRNEILHLIERWNSGNYRFLNNFKSSALLQFWLSEINETDNHSEAASFIYSKNSSIKAFLILAPLAWESRIFSKKMSTIKFIVYDPTDEDAHIIIKELINTAIIYAKENKCDFLSSKIYSNDIHIIHALQSMSFFLVDAMLDFIYDFQKKPFLNQLHKNFPKINYEIRSANILDLPSTIAMVKKSFGKHFGRFHSDPRISKEKADEVYCEWIKSAFNGYADHIIVAVLDNQVIGCSLWKKQSSLENKYHLPIAHYSLGCVHPQHSGKGIFQEITNYGIKYFSNQSIRFIEGPTHINNHPVQSAYTRLGWTIMDARYTFHLWF